MRAGSGTIWLIATLLAFLPAGCGTTGNDGEREIKLFADRAGLALTDPKCPNEDEEDFEGKTMRCTATIAQPDGTARAIDVDIAYDDCSTKRNRCDDVRVTPRLPRSR